MLVLCFFMEWTNVDDKENLWKWSEGSCRDDLSDDEVMEF
jgi:hypothetical protein